MRVARGRYFEERLQKGLGIQKRQEIEESNLWEPNKAVRLWKIHGKAFLHIISYGWLAPHHPDPENFHLHRLVVIIGKLRQHMQAVLPEAPSDIAIAIDFCSLYQQPRSAEQDQEFREGLRGFNDMYIDEDIMAWKMTAMPLGTERSYRRRGWTFAESLLIDAKPGGNNMMAFDESFQPDSETTSGWAFKEKFMKVQDIQPPLSPEDMRAGLDELRGKVEAAGQHLFTSGKDCKLVPEIYKDCFQLERCQCLNCDAKGWNASQVQKLCRVLPRCEYLICLSLCYNPLVGDEGIVDLCGVLPKLQKLRILSLDECGVGDDAAASRCLR